jgi:coenzyme F420-0:L-glutamate ligase/coenzyme F420-1:gamma-L-glutamate ligase
MRAITVFGLEKIGHVKHGDDVAELIAEAAKRENLIFSDGDVLVISQKIVSKADGLLVDTSRIKPTRRAKALAKQTGKDPRLIDLILRDSSTVLRADAQALVVRRKDGLVCLNAGVDKSNVRGRFFYSRLPLNSDASANMILARLRQLTGRRLAVIVADTYSRPLRVGQVEFTIGVAGMEPIVDYRGLEDLFGYRLRYKFVALADEVAAAAELVMGQGKEGIPVAIIRGLDRIKSSPDAKLSRKLLLGRRLDLFRGLT